jgi:hypothetical protein
VSIDVSDFESLEEIDKVYDRKIRLADDEDQPRLQQEKGEARLAFRESLAIKREAAQTLREALTEYPLAKKFEAMITAKTPEAIRAQAKTFHETVEAERAAAETAVREELAPAVARAQYGSPSAGGGSPVTNPGEVDPTEALRARVLSRLQAGNAPTRADSWAYGGMRIAEAAQQARTDPNYTSVDYKRDAPARVDARNNKRKGA